MGQGEGEGVKGWYRVRDGMVPLAGQGILAGGHPHPQLSPSPHLQGGFFLMADTSKLTVPQKYLDEKTHAAPDGVTRDWALCA